MPLQIELEEFETRLERLKQAYEEGKETEAKDTQERVKNAIMAHENRIALLKKKNWTRIRSIPFGVSELLLARDGLGRRKERFVLFVSESLRSVCRSRRQICSNRHPNWLHGYFFRLA